MRPIRRNDLSARVELLPLIDVIFLLLTFFIYSLILMHRAEILPVTLLPVTGGQKLAAGDVHAVTIDAAGQFHFDRAPISREALRNRLAEFAAQENAGTLLVAAEDQGQNDRLPLFLELWQMIRDAGIENFHFVGEPLATEPASP